MRIFLSYFRPHLGLFTLDMAYRRYEKGTREIPVWAVIKLAKFYNTSTDYILGLSDQRTLEK